MSDETPTPRPSKSLAIYAEACRGIVARLEALDASGLLDDEGKVFRHEGRNLLAFYEPHLDPRIGPPHSEDRKAAGERVFKLHAAVSAYLQRRGIEK